MSASPASSVAQIACVQGIPTINNSGRLDANSAPIFDSHTALCCGRTSLFSGPEPIMDLIGISGFQPQLDVYLHRKIALNGSAA